MMKRILALILAGMMLLGNVVSAETISWGYDNFERLSSVGANLYIDESITAEYLMTEALKKVINEKPELEIELIKAAFSSLDEYTEFYTKEEYELFKKNIDKIVYGIGVIIQLEGDYVTVLSCVDDGGAKAAGVQPGDKIAKVNGVDVKGASVDKVQDMIVGELGTQVTVTFLRDEQEFEFVITRKEVRGQTVAGEILEDGIGYIAIINFAQNTAAEFSEILWQFEMAGVKKIILDLRNNPGGYLEPAIAIAQMTVPQGTIVKTVYRDGLSGGEAVSKIANPKFKFCVLINRNTASAAEVLASAMGESGVGHLAGEISYGKGVIQSMFEMPDGSAFKITTGRYFTRNGHDINGNGIEPHEFVENSTELIDLSKFHTFDYKTKPNIGTVSTNVRAAKERLKIMGYYQGNINDTFEPEFHDVIYKFQAENGLGAYGVLDIATQVKMENIFYKIEVEVDDQLRYAYEYLGGNPENLDI
ncbi:MAG: PDZ domain-containing protein [Clostridia bacterium]|nr:PDZ domain-containing protein [Clostridia bacterium]